MVRCMDATHDKQRTDDPSGIPGHEALGSASQALFERHSSEELQRFPAPGSAAPALAVDPADALASRQMVRKAVLGIVRSADATICAKLGRRAEAIPGVSPAFIDKLIAGARLPEAQAEEMAELSALVAEKWDLNLKYATEIALVISAGGWLLGIAFAIRALDKREAEVKQAEKN
jgi:hypothetical protein